MRQLALALVLVLVGCDAVGEVGTSEAAGGGYCGASTRAFERTSDTALPSLARQILHHGCDPAAACDVALSERLPQGDSPPLSEAIQILGCLHPVDSDQVDPPTLIAPLPGENPYTSVLLVNGSPYAFTSGFTSSTPLGNGSGDFVLPDGTRFTVLQMLRGGALKQVSVVAGGSSGLYRTANGGAEWYWASGPGSGLEATTKNAQALIRTVTPQGGIDLLVGIAGTTNGGVYLSGDGGEDWMQINQGFDPNTLNITTLAATSCGGCPVQYYSGTYGSGVYTRTIAVTPPPQISGWCFGSTTCTCGTAAPTGPAAGGQALKVCGANFQYLPKVQFGADGVRKNATGCTTVSANVITCTGTPSGSGYVPFRVLNIDTRAGVAATGYSYN